MIINADDFGWDSDTTDATIELFEKRIIKSATIMTGMPSTDAAVAYALENQNRYSFGLHFNIVDDHKSLAFNVASTLTNFNGRFRKSNEQRIRALSFRISRIEIASEFEAQVLCLKNRGVTISHIDSHGHLHKFPEVIEAIKPVMKEHGIHRVRYPQSLYQTRNFKRSILNAYCHQYFKLINHPDNSYFVSDHANKNWLNDFIKLLPAGVTELGIHPGHVDEWRYAEIAPLIDMNASKLLISEKINLLSYLDI